MPNDDGNSSTGAKWENNGFALHGNSGRLRLSDLGDRLNNILGESESLSEFEKIGDTEQSDVSNGHWETLAQTITGTASHGIRNRAIVSIDPTVTLEELINPALTVLREVMDVPLNEDDPNFARILSTKKDAAVSIVNAALKADENRFRQKKSNILEELLTRMEKAKQTEVIVIS